MHRQLRTDVDKQRWARTNRQRQRPCLILYLLGCLSSRPSRLRAAPVSSRIARDDVCHATLHSIMVLATCSRSKNGLRASQERPRAAQEQPKSEPRAAKSALRADQSRPRAVKMGLRAAKSALPRFKINPSPARSGQARPETDKNRPQS